MKRSLDALLRLAGLEEKTAEPVDELNKRYRAVVQDIVGHLDVLADIVEKTSSEIGRLEKARDARPDVAYSEDGPIEQKIAQFVAARDNALALSQQLKPALRFPFNVWGKRSR